MATNMTKSMNYDKKCEAIKTNEFYICNVHDKQPNLLQLTTNTHNYG